MSATPPSGSSRDARPLAERMRPARLDQYVGQRHLLGQGKILDSAINQGRLPSLILWGPPGSGKTTLARLLADAVGARFVPLSAVLAGIKDIREQVAQARDMRQMLQQTTVLFVDEIHRFNKAQQDALLPHVEDGTITLVGATTENPGFEVNAALLSRCRTLVLESLSDEDIAELSALALRDRERGLGDLALELSEEARASLCRAAQGDARAAITALEIAAQAVVSRNQGHIEPEDIAQAFQRRMVRYDKDGDQHYQTVSAFIKSMRGSDPDAALYYMVRMLEGGEDPMFVLRRMVIFASEDIGNADPRALAVAMDAMRAFEFMGMPEGVLPMTQAATYLACAPKSNAALSAYGKARKDVLDFGTLPVPQDIINAHTRFAKELGHGRGYKYPHNFSGNYAPGVQYLPDALRGRRYYEPSDNGEERAIGERLRGWRGQREN